MAARPTSTLRSSKDNDAVCFGAPHAPSGPLRHGHRHRSVAVSPQRLECHVWSCLQCPYPHSSDHNTGVSLLLPSAYATPARVLSLCVGTPTAPPLWLDAQVTALPFKPESSQLTEVCLRPCGVGQGKRGRRGQVSDFRPVACRRAQRASRARHPDASGEEREGVRGGAGVT